MTKALQLVGCGCMQLGGVPSTLQCLAQGLRLKVLLRSTLSGNFDVNFQLQPTVRKAVAIQAGVQGPCMYDQHYHRAMVGYGAHT